MARIYAEIEENLKASHLLEMEDLRLAACFLDSIAALGLNEVRSRLNYHFGIIQTGI